MVFEELTNRIARITPSGRFSGSYIVPPEESFPAAITVDPSGNLWFAGLRANEIVRANPRLLTKAPPKSKKPVKKAVKRKH